jgi:hypothetical protein
MAQQPKGRRSVFIGGLLFVLADGYADRKHEPPEVQEELRPYRDIAESFAALSPADFEKRKSEVENLAKEKGHIVSHGYCSLPSVVLKLLGKEGIDEFLNNG